MIILNDPIFLVMSGIKCYFDWIRNNISRVIFAYVAKRREVMSHGHSDGQFRDSGVFESVEAQVNEKKRRCKNCHGLVSMRMGKIV